jgi:hypothetical protein
MSQIYALEGMGAGRGLITGGIARAKQLAALRKANADRDKDLPKLPAGSLGNFRSGMQCVPSKVGRICATLRFFSLLCACLAFFYGCYIS